MIQTKARRLNVQRLAFMVFSSTLEIKSCGNTNAAGYCWKYRVYPTPGCSSLHRKRQRVTLDEITLHDPPPILAGDKTLGGKRRSTS